MFVIFFLAFGVAASEPIFNKCKLSDEVCIRETAEQLVPYFAAGIPEYNVPTIDPYTPGLLDYSYLGLKFVLSDVVITGLKGCKVPKLSIKNSTMYSVIVCDINVSAKYVIDGKLLIVPVHSKGTSKMALNQMEVSSITQLLEYTGTDGKKHWELKPMSRQIKLLDTAKIAMDDLFGEKSILGQTLNTLFNYYSNDIINDLLPSDINKVVGHAIKSVSNFFVAFPIEDLVQ